MAIVAIFSILASLEGKVFLSPQNVSNLFRQMTVTSFLAMGMVFVIVTGNIDLVGKLGRSRSAGRGHIFRRRSGTSSSLISR